MARGMNKNARRKILEALETIHSPFTSAEMGNITGLEPQRVQGLLRSTEGVEKEHVSRSKGGINGTPSGRVRCQWRVVE